MKHDKQIIGRVEKVAFPKLNLFDVPAKIDTGAKTSSIWASQIKLSSDGYLSFCLFDKSSPYFDARKIATKNFKETIVISSMGVSEHRYKVKLAIRVRDRTIRASFTLSNRSKQLYPILIGRNILRGKFLVDVAGGNPMRGLEREYSDKLQSALKSRQEGGRQ